MTIQLELSPETERRIVRKAADCGVPVERYVTDLVEKDVDPVAEYERIMAPVWEGFAKSGVTEEEWDEIIENEREAIWREKHCTPSRVS